jgi:general secretion pathway protein I
MRNRGFTLIEIVVAMAILGVGLIVIIELFSGGLRLGRISEEYTQAIGLARMKLEEISLAEQLREGSEKGEFNKDFRWQVGVKKVDLLLVEKGLEFKPPVEFYQIKVNITWKSGYKERSTEIEFYRTIPFQALEAEK